VTRVSEPARARDVLPARVRQQAQPEDLAQLRRALRPAALRSEALVTNGKNCWDVGATLDDLRHRPLVSRKQARGLRLRDAVERKAGALTEHRAPRKR